MAKQIIVRECIKCKQIKPLSEFYKDKSRKYGRRYDCKKCSYVSRKNYYATKIGCRNIIKSCQKYYKTNRGKANNKKQSRLYHIRYPERRKATCAVNNKIIKGDLAKPTKLKCHYCPNQAKEYHHWHGHAKKHWFDIVPICIPCHNKLRLI